MSEHDPDVAAPEPPHGSLFDPAAEPAAPVIVTRRRGGTPWPVTLVLTAGLAGAGYWAWTHPQSEAGPQDTQDGQQIQALAGRVDALEKRSGPVAGEATAALAKRLDDVSGHVDALSAKQDQLQAERAKASEIAAQKTSPADNSAPPADHTAQDIPGLIAQQQAVDKTKVTEPATAGSPDLKSTLDALDQRLSKLETAAGSAPAQADTGQRPQAADPAALAALNDRVAKLEQAGGQPRTDTAQGSPVVDVAAMAALTDRLAKLEQTAGQTEAQTDAARTAQQQAQQGDTATLASLSDRLGKLEQASSQVQSQDVTAQKAQAEAQAQAQATATQTLVALDSRVAKLEQGAGQAQGEASGAARDATRAIRLEAAAAALQAGQPLGDLPGAPSALSRYANSAPPTEIALRADFPRVAEAARAVSQPNTANRSFLDRAFTRLQQSVVVRQGDHVVVGDPAAGVLARAQASVAAGDLKTAADTLGALTGQAADAVHPWVSQVHDLLDARAALATMAAHG